MTFHSFRSFYYEIYYNEARGFFGCGNKHGSWTQGDRYYRKSKMESRSIYIDLHIQLSVCKSNRSHVYNEHLTSCYCALRICFIYAYLCTCMCISRIINYMYLIHLTFTGGCEDQIIIYYIPFLLYCGSVCGVFFLAGWGGGGMKVLYWPFKSPISFCMKLGFGVEWIPKYPKQYFKFWHIPYVECI